jgi:DNA-binding response OmpR family regulator
VPPKPQGSILLADDEPLLVRLVCRVLEGAGYRVSTATTPDAACEALESNEPADAAVLDATLSRRMGKDVLRRALTSGGPGIILISGAELEPELHRLLARHGGRFLAKPFEPVQLVRAVREVLAERSD